MLEAADQRAQTIRLDLCVFSLDDADQSPDQLSVVVLQKGRYVKSKQSVCLPGLDVEASLSPFLARRAEVPMSQVQREFQAWVRDQG